MGVDDLVVEWLKIRQKLAEIQRKSLENWLA